MVAVSLKKNFFKQKTAYEITTRLVGSEMCIRDSLRTDGRPVRVGIVGEYFTAVDPHSNLRLERKLLDLSLIHI